MAELRGMGDDFELWDPATTLVPVPRGWKFVVVPVDNVNGFDEASVDGRSGSIRIPDKRE